MAYYCSICMSTGELSHYIPPCRPESNFPRHIEAQIVFPLCSSAHIFLALLAWQDDVHKSENQSSVFSAARYSSEDVYFHSQRAQSKRKLNSGYCVCLQLDFMTIDKIQISLTCYNIVDYDRTEGEFTVHFQDPDCFCILLLMVILFLM